MSSAYISNKVTVSNEQGKTLNTEGIGLEERHLGASKHMIVSGPITVIDHPIKLMKVESITHDQIWIVIQ